jgi:PAS domain S-box-containing protein
MQNKNTDLYFFNGGGEMGKFIRAKDWSKTPLGDPKGWPASLCTMVSVMLNNPFGMYIAWGKEYTQIYNDGYRPILGATKHPQALGISSRETFSEIWHIIESMFDGVMDGTPVGFPDFMLPLDRNGFVETCFFDFAYSPIRMENGEVGGVLVTVIETTDKKKSEIAIQESKNQLEFAIEAAELGTFDYDPISKKFVANNRLKEWYGLPSEHEIDLTYAINAIVEKDKARVIETTKKALEYASGGKYDVEYTIINPVTKKEFTVHAKGRICFDNQKIAYRLNGTVEDVSEKIKARQKIKNSEQVNRQMVLEAPIGICVIDVKTLVIEIANERFVEIAGKPYETIIGKYYWETFAELKLLYEEALNSVVQTGIPYFANEVPILLIRDGRAGTIYVTFVYSPVKNEKGKVTKIAVWIVDNTLHVESLQKVAQSESNLKLMILQAPVAIAILRDLDYKVEIANNNALELWRRTEDEIVGKSIFHSMPELLNQGIKELLDDVRTTGNRFTTAELPLQFLKNGLLEEVYINFSYEPLHDGDGKTNGIMAIGFDVTPQVLARKKVEESEQSIRTLVESAPFPIAVYMGEEMRITLANQAIMEAWGKGNNVVGKLYTDILPEFENQQIFDQIRAVLETGVPFHAKNQKVDLLINGLLKSYYFNYSFTPLFDTGGNVYGVMNTAAEVTELNEAKHKIEESEKRFRSSVQQAPLGIAIFRGPHYIVEMANENYLLLIDRKEEEFIGKPLFEALPEVKSLVQPLFQEVINSENAFSSPDLPVLLKRNGKIEEAFFNIVYHPLKEENEEIFGIMVVATEVTKTVIAKHLLEESEKQFRNMVMQSPIPMTVLKGREYITESANTAMFETIWRKKEADVIGRSILDIFPELREQKYPLLLDEVFTYGKRHSEKESIAYVQGDDGIKMFYLDFDYAPLFETDGTVAGIMITVNDVTDKVEARLKVENAEERSRLAAEATDLATWELDLNTRHIIHSPRLAVIFGHDKSAILTHVQMRSQIHPEDIHDIAEKAFDEAMKTGIYSYEARILKPDNTFCWIRTQGKVFFDKNNKPVKKLGTLRDITEEKQYQQVLQKSEAKFRLLADSMPQFIWTADPQGNLNYFNQSVYNYSGLSLEKIIKDGWLQIVHPEERKKNKDTWKQSIETGKDFLLEHRFRKHNGEYRWQLSRAIAQKDENGKISMWVGTSTDIQDQKMFTDELEKQVSQRTGELNQKNLDLEKMNKELQSFTYISSHDLQEPLRKIQIFASQITDRESENLSNTGMDKFQRIQKAAFRMQTLIQDLLAYSRTNTQERKFEKINLKNIIEDVKEDLEEELHQKQAIVEIGEMCEVKVIPFQFRQLLFNLISNSLKFSNAIDLPLIKINSEIAKGVQFDNVKLSNDINYCHISITDNGIGFEQQYSEKIFLVFQRLHGKEEYNGTGIGLAIVKKIVENHNGFITAKGELNKGATFEMYIPS